MRHHAFMRLLAQTADRLGVSRHVYVVGGAVRDHATTPSARTA